MRHVLFLAWRYIAYHRVKSAILTICLTLTIVLPLTAHLLIGHYGEALLDRARATPLLAGAKGNRFDLVLKALYFGAADIEGLPMSEVERIRDTGLASAIPLHLFYTARGYPIVGTSLEYFEFRGLDVAAGTLPLRLGQAVLGADIAAELGLGPGDSLFSDQTSVYDISSTYPLKMHVAGVLAPTGAPDDRAVFVDVKTAWIIDGHSHGHLDVSRTHDDALVLQRTEQNVTASPAVVEYNEVTPENIEAFHTHADSTQLPLSAVIVVATDDKSATMLSARYNLSAAYRILEPEEVVEELLGLVFRIKKFFDASMVLIVFCTLLFTALIILLSRRLREREMQTMHRIGCSRWIVFWMQAAEVGIVLSASVVLAFALSMLGVWLAPHFVRIL